MDLNDYWQENKRFVTTVAAGATVFLVGYLILSGRYEERIGAQKSQERTLRSELGGELFSIEDLETAEDQNEALVAAVEALEAGTAFRPRDLFRLRKGGGAGSASSQYLQVLDQVRAELVPRAKRNSMQIVEGLGMPELSPTREDEIERYLEALDVIETVVLLAIQAGARNLDKINVRLDPNLSTRQGVGSVETTRITFHFDGPALPLTQVLKNSQRPPDGRPLLVDEVAMVALAAKPGEARLEFTVAVARLHDVDGEDED